MTHSLYLTLATTLPFTQYCARSHRQSISPSLSLSTSLSLRRSLAVTLIVSHPLALQLRLSLSHSLSLSCTHSFALTMSLAPSPGQTHTLAHSTHVHAPPSSYSQGAARTHALPVQLQVWWLSCFAFTTRLSVTMLCDIPVKSSMTINVERLPLDQNEFSLRMSCARKHSLAPKNNC